jgi:hypothetical protein
MEPGIENVVDHCQALSFAKQRCAARHHGSVMSHRFLFNSPAVTQEYLESQIADRRSEARSDNSRIESHNSPAYNESQWTLHATSAIHAHREL